MNRFPDFQVYVRLKPSSIHGIGVFAIQDIPANTPVFYGDDENLIWIEESYVLGCSCEIQRLYKDFCVMKSGKYGCPKNFNALTPAWYLNHSETPNVVIDKDYRFFSSQDIRTNEELTVNYSTFSE